MDQVPVMLPLDTAFETERNEETDRNGGQVDEMSRQLCADSCGG
jgi:hypothetical protein